MCFVLSIHCHAYIHAVQNLFLPHTHTGADPGFQVRWGGGGALKKIFLGVFRVKNHDFTPKKSYFFQF